MESVHQQHDMALDVLRRIEERLSLYEPLNRDSSVAAQEIARLSRQIVNLDSTELNELWVQLYLSSAPKRICAIARR